MHHGGVMGRPPMPGDANSSDAIGSQQQRCLPLPLSEYGAHLLSEMSPHIQISWRIWCYDIILFLVWSVIGLDDTMREAFLSKK